MCESNTIFHITFNRCHCQQQKENLEIYYSLKGL